MNALTLARYKTRRTQIYIHTSSELFHRIIACADESLTMICALEVGRRAGFSSLFPRYDICR